MRIFFDDKNGAGDKINVLPVLRLLKAQGHEVFTRTIPESIYLGTGILSHQEGTTYDAVVNMQFSEMPDIPGFSTVPANIILQRIFHATGIDLVGQFGSGLEFDEEELEFIEIKRGLEYINFFPYTNINQKCIAPAIAREIVEFCLAKGWSVCTTPVLYDNNTYPWNKIFAGGRYHSPYPYFDRRWFLDVAGARLNICLDGGPFNVSLATGAKTLGLLTIADTALCQLYKSDQWRVSQSTMTCSPCFKLADYTNGEVKDCPHPKNGCGAHFDLADIFRKIEELYDR